MAINHGGAHRAASLAVALCVMLATPPASAVGKREGPATQCSGAGAVASVVRDDFDGTQIDASLWNVDANAGSVTVAGGAVRVAAPSVTSFPLVRSAVPLIPATGEFSVRWAAQYEQSTVHGTCTLVGSRGLPTDGGPNTSSSAFGACQDHGIGYNVTAATSSTSSTQAHSVPDDTLERVDVEYCWLADRVEVWVDGVRRFDAARDASLLVPDSLWFGNYARGAVNAPWSNFSIDFIEVLSFDSSARIFADGYEALP
jgi:hypothetical protein